MTGAPGGRLVAFENADGDAGTWSQTAFVVGGAASVSAYDSDLDDVPELVGSDRVCHRATGACQDVSGPAFEFVSLVSGDLDGDGAADLVFAWNAPGSAAFGWLRSVPRPCDDDFDNDADTLVDYPSDPGCSAKADPDLSEGSPLLACDDDVDNDGDGLEDFPEDPGCELPSGGPENPFCQDGIDNDGDGTRDFDGGASIHGAAVSRPDAECVGRPWHDFEVRLRGSGCGIGIELALLVPLLMWRHAHARRRVPR